VRAKRALDDAARVFPPGLPAVVVQALVDHVLQTGDNGRAPLPAAPAGDDLPKKGPWELRMDEIRTKLNK